jgi:sorbose reductase
MPLAAPSNPSAPVLSHFSLANKVACVTGGARGIGLEVVRGLAEAGASVALIYTSSKDAAQTAEQISSATGQKVTAYQSDVRSKAAITSTINQIAADFGRLDICVANAGIAAHQGSLEYAEEDWIEMMSVNLNGAMFTAQAAGNIFKKQQQQGLDGFAGSMIFTASVSALLVNVPQTQCAYNASKAAVVHLAKSLAVEWTEFARVNCISPGFIETESEFLRIFCSEYYWLGRGADSILLLLLSSVECSSPGMAR